VTYHDTFEHAGIASEAVTLRFSAEPGRVWWNAVKDNRWERQLFVDVDFREARRLNELYSSGPQQNSANANETQRSSMHGKTQAVIPPPMESPYPH
jgi:hypothetical protein